MSTVAAAHSAAALSQQRLAEVPGVIHIHDSFSIGTTTGNEKRKRKHLMTHTQNPPTQPKRRRGRPPGFTMTAEHKDKIRLAQIRRWAVRKHLAKGADK
jgi:hypothetical protein